MTDRRSLLAGSAGLATPLLLGRRAGAQDRSIQVGIFNGVQADFMQREVIARFERERRVRVFTTRGPTAAHIARLRATRERPTFSVMCMDAMGVEIAARDGLLAKLSPGAIPNLANVFPRFIINDDHAVAFAVSVAGLFYNPQAIRPLASYGELWDRRFRRRFSMVSPTYPQSVCLLIATAALVTGKPFAEAQHLIDQAWPRMEELRPNLHNIYAAEADIMQIAQGEADVGGIEYSKTIYPYTMRGADVTMCFPREGSFAGLNCLVQVKDGPEPELAAAFIDLMLDASVQKPLAEVTVAAPPIRGLDFAPELARLMAYPVERMDDLGMFNPDWAALNPLRGGWIERLNQLFTRR